jgi:hypothetical protein
MSPGIKKFPPNEDDNHILHLNPLQDVTLTMTLQEFHEFIVAMIEETHLIIPE